MKVTAASSFLLLAALVQAQFDPTIFPERNMVPAIDSPQMKEWLKDINFADVPAFPQHTGNPPACQQPAPTPPDQCWWTCQRCPGTDIEACPNPGDWGLTFDDGPTQFTPALLDTLKQLNLKATFFVMGSNVVLNPDVLKRELAEGHHLASHTWSHHALTTLTNQQIVAEVKWAEKAVEDITGLRMKYLRPPYGDMDNRVRAVLKKLGYTVVDWTSDAFDTKDFELNLNPGNLTSSLARFNTNIQTHAKSAAAPPGIITLEHDLYKITVDFAAKMLPDAVTAGLKIKTVADCLGDANGYQGGTPPNVGGNPTVGGGNKPKSAAGALEFSLKTVGVAAVVALAGSMGMFL